MQLLHFIFTLSVAIFLCAPVTHSGQLSSQIKAADSGNFIREKREVPRNGTESLCSALKGECVCKAHRRKEHSLVCLKKDCMKKLPTEKLSLKHASQIVSLLIRRQRSITSIRDNELRPLGNVRSLRIFNCQISSVSPGAFIGLNFVERLDLHRNKLTEVPKAIAYLRNLKYLNLGGNQISFLKPGAFYSNSQLERLVLSRNLLGDLPTNFPFPPNVVKLSVSHNDLRDLGNLALLKNLEVLHAESNMITDIPRVPNTIKVLNLCGNRINKEISVGRLVNLRKLSVSNNPQIGTISLSTFRDQNSRTMASKLKSVIVKNSGIRSIDTKAFACLPNLHLIDISGNKLHQFKPEWFIGNRKLRGIFVDENPWQCHCHMESSLAEIERLFAKRRRLVEKKSKRRNKLSSRKSEVFQFANDFKNVSCVPTGPRSFRKCTPFNLIEDSCKNLDLSIWNVPDIRRVGPITSTTQPMIKTTTLDTVKTTLTITTEPPVTTTPTVTTTKTSTTSPTTTIPPTSTTRSTTTASTTTTLPPTTTTQKTESTTASTLPPTTTTTMPPTTTTSTTSSTRPPLKTTTLRAVRTTTKPIVIPPTIPPETPPPSTPPTTTTATTTTTSTTTLETTTKKIEWCLKDGRKCAFPFHYDGEDHYECIGFTNWCSPTYEYTSDWDRCIEC